MRQFFDVRKICQTADQNKSADIKILLTVAVILTRGHKFKAIGNFNFAAERRKTAYSAVLCAMKSLKNATAVLMELTGRRSLVPCVVSSRETGVSKGEMR